MDMRSRSNESLAALLLARALLDPDLLPIAEEVAARLTEAAPKGRNSPSEAFLRFWDAWPRHPRKTDRAGAYRVWKRDGLDATAESVIGAVLAFADSTDWRKDEGAYIPAPEVWLNKRRYLGADAIGVSRSRPDWGSMRDGEQPV